jgi:Fe-S-cluster containining protein
MEFERYQLKNPLPDWVAGACTRCGKCCLDEQYMTTLSATSEDVKRWCREARYDILEYVARVGQLGNDLWVKDGVELSRCPFVRKDRAKLTYHCTIYETRPAACRGYPYSAKQMLELGCEIVGQVEAVASAIGKGIDQEEEYEEVAE